MNKGAKLSTGILGLDARIGGGLPQGGLGISIIGPHGLGKRILCMQILYEALKRGEPGLYVSVDKSFFDIRGMFAQLGMNLKHYEECKRFMIIDCTGTKPRTGENTDNIEFVNPSDGIEAYREKCLMIKKAIVGGGGVDVIDSTNQLMERIGSPDEIRELQMVFKIEIGQRMKTIGLHIIDEGTSRDEEARMIRSFDMPTIKFRENEPHDQIRISNFPDIKRTGWLDFELTKKGVIVQQAVDIENKIETKYLEEAIKLASKSKAEDGRVHPKVGAVIIKTSKIVAEAYRGEIRNGEHAEYTALERKSVDKNLRGATLITTLEPCTTRHHPKIPCAEHIIKRGIKKVVIGILDPNPDIRGKGYFILIENGVGVEFFPVKLVKRIWQLNKEFISEQRES
ncbi:MAG: hypothetical protein FVQ84_12540 [Planctomycetes bacterium]|nr:hypothetical protein [Planctomycetota bacterium]